MLIRDHWQVSFVAYFLFLHKSDTPGACRIIDNN